MAGLSPHEECREHGLQCKKIRDNREDIMGLRVEQAKVWDHLDEKMNSKMLMGVLSAAVVLFLGLFTASIQMNRNAIEDMMKGGQERTQLIQQLSSRQGELKESMAAMKESMAFIRNDVESLKKMRSGQHQQQ